MHKEELANYFGRVGHGLGRLLGRGFQLRRPAVPDGLRVYAVGDIHGRFDLLDILQEQIAADLEIGGPEHSIEVYLGDYVDRGPQSREVVEFLMTGSKVCDQRICLRGNHEEMLLSTMQQPSLLVSWFECGGRETLESYGVNVPAELTPASVSIVLRAFFAEFPDAHRYFLQSLPYLYVTGSYAFVHAGINPARKLASQNPKDLISIREPFLSTNANFEHFVVHGHTPTSDPDVRPNRMNIDTGAFLTGRLTCLVLEGEEYRFIQATTS